MNDSMSTLACTTQAPALREAQLPIRSAPWRYSQIAGYVASVVSAVGIVGCGPKIYPEKVFGEPPREAITDLAPGVLKAQTELSRMILNGPAIAFTSTGQPVSYDECWRTALKYLLRRVDLSSSTLNSSLAVGVSNSDLLHDSEYMKTLGVLLASDNYQSMGPSVSPSRADVSNLRTIKQQDNELLDKGRRAEIFLRSYSGFLSELSPNDPNSSEQRQARLVQCIAVILAADTNRLQTKTELSADSIKARLEELLMVSEWLKCCATIRFQEGYAAAKTMLDTYSPAAGEEIVSDFATFNAAWAQCLPTEQRTAWLADKPSDKTGLFVLATALYPTNFRGGSAAPEVTPTSDENAVTAQVTGAAKKD